MATQVNQQVSESNVPQCRCGHCGELGHSVRNCNDPHISNQVTDFYLRIGRNESIESIISWFMENRTEREMRLLCMKTLNVSYHKTFNESEIKYMLRCCIKKINDDEFKIYMDRLCNKVIKMKQKNISATLEQFTRFCIGHNLMQIPDVCDKFQEFNEFVMNLRGVAKSSILEKIQSCGFTQEVLRKIIGFYDYLIAIREQVEYEEQSRLNMRRIQREVNKIKILQKNLTEKSSELIDCPICMETIDEEQVALTNCNHKFCKSCIIKACETKNLNGQSCVCPMCRTQIKSISISV